ncbi:MAG: alpha/beta hydrolase-fold protein [Balneolaceae bacterium]|nr:alpha/beta hydrolase-fold protein [Balneolaceae bacterium]
MNIRHMKKVFLASLFLSMFIASSYAQETQRLQTISLDSKVMDQERSIKVYLPEEYSDEKTYPVIYITDASTSNFETAKSYLDALTTPVYDAVPPSILVGISHKNRNAELNVFRKESGEKFKRHLFDEVVPAIDTAFSTSGFNTMIGHSNGAEFNHFLLLEEDNPFRGFISMSTNFNTDVRSEISDFFKTYQGKQIYYFIANGTRDGFMRVDAGNEMEELYNDSSNPNIYLMKETYSADHQSIVPLSLVDGLSFVFKDYKNTEKYTSVIDYGENFLDDLERLYGIKGVYSMDDLGPFFMDILENKKMEEYRYIVNLINEYNLFYGRGIDPVNQANNYFSMDMMPETIEYWNKAIDDFDSVNPQVFYANHSKALKAYSRLDRKDEMIPFLVRVKETLPEEYTLRMNYRIAYHSAKHQLAPESGKRALEYCKSNFEENGLFTMDDLLALEKELYSLSVNK